MHTHIMHIIKNNIFFAFKQVFYVVMGSKNIQTSFKAIGFILYSFNQMFNYLDFKPHTFTPLNIFQWNLNSIIPNTFYIAKNVLQNFVDLKSKITKHHNNLLFIYMN